MRHLHDPNRHGMRVVCLRRGSLILPPDMAWWRLCGCCWRLALSAPQAVSPGVYLFAAGGLAGAFLRHWDSEVRPSPLLWGGPHTRATTMGI